MSYFYGPVLSRRLGFSLGVDLIPKKVCSFDCLYCQVGVTTTMTARRFFKVDLVVFKKELKDILRKQPKIDYITFSGSGEPTLHKDLDKLIRIVKKITKNRYPICVITNSSLLYRKDVRKELKEADLIVPSLDAAGAKTFHEINRPAKGITFKKIVEGLIALRKEFKGQIWLEIMILANINDSIKEAKEFKRIVDKVNPDKIQLNLPVRPAPIKLKLSSKEKIDKIKEIIDSNIEVAESSLNKEQKKCLVNAQDKIMEYLRRRPATLDDLVGSLGLDVKEVNICVNNFIKENKIKEKVVNKKCYYIGNN
ncbi:MAG: radical SAM protein [Candidatus Omnitrophica bacterium]|nr:radical SAM protein [Candidatus Omnitrophota bacterium]